MELADEAGYWYRKRYRIETFFSGQKSWGFHLNKSHLDDPERISRLMIAACLAYIWIVFLGALFILEGWSRIIHRSDRCDLSLFQLGLRTLEHFLNEDIPIPVVFQMLELDGFA
ncbi:MAG: transposase [Anaerolineae bacterium]|nr:transposase [Anaerolineae bacterium]